MFKFKRNKLKEEENPIVMERLNWDVYIPKKIQMQRKGNLLPVALLRF